MLSQLTTKFEDPFLPAWLKCSSYNENRIKWPRAVQWISTHPDTAKQFVSLMKSD